jgi:hypothetical protein
MTLDLNFISRGTETFLLVAIKEEREVTVSAAAHRRRLRIWPTSMCFVCAGSMEAGMNINENYRHAIAGSNKPVIVTF